MFIDISKTKSKSGKVYTRTLLRKSYREDGKVKHKTIGNLSDCSEQEINAIRYALQNRDRLPPLNSTAQLPPGYSLIQGISVGSTILLHQIAQRLGIISALGNDRSGKLALWQVMARIIDQGSRLSSVRLATSHAACDVIGMDSFDEDDLYENLDWLSTNQAKIEQRLFKKKFGTKKPEIFLYDVTSSYLEGQLNELAAFGYNRDGKKGKKQIVVGLLCDQNGDPLSIEVFKGNTSDSKTMPEQIKKAVQWFGCEELTFVGDRGMIKGTVIDELHSEGFHYITAMTKPQIETLLKKEIIQMSLFDEQVVEIEEKLTGVRYILRRNPCRAKEISQSRLSKKSTIAKFLEDKNQYLSTHPKAKVETAEKMITEKIKQLKVENWLSVTTNQRQLSLVVSNENLIEESKLDGCYIIKTDVSKTVADAQTVHDRYKDLADVEWAFRISKTVELEMRPVNVRKEFRTRGHVFVVMLAYMIIRKLARLWHDIDLKVEEGINELSTLCLSELRIKGVTQCNIVPEPRPSVKKLLNAAHITLPSVIPSRHAHVATIKKLVENRL